MSELALAFGVPWMAAVALLSVRIAALFMMTPPFYAVPLPGLVRALMGVGLAVALALPMATVAPSVQSLGDFVRAGMIEAALGATLGLGVLAAFAGFSVAGRVLDVQVGFGMGQVFDPVTQTQTPILTSVFNLVAVLLFLLANGHHAILRGIAYSIDKFPVGRPWPIASAARPVLEQISGLFTLGFALASPVVMCLLLVEFMLAVISRNLPQINMLVLGVPVKVVVGLCVLSLLATTVAPASARLYNEIYRTWTVMFEQPALQAGGKR